MTAASCTAQTTQTTLTPGNNSQHKHARVAMISPAQCHFTDFVNAYLDGTMDDVTAVAFESHVDQCATCLALLGEKSTVSVADDWLELLHASLPGDATPKSSDMLTTAAVAVKNVPQDGLRYVCRRLIGTGGCGEVWEAWDLVLGRAVALKLLREPSPSVHETERLIQEAEALARLSHPNIVSLFELQNRQGRPALIMELVRGPSLSQYLRGQPCPPRAAAEVLEKLCRAVEHAHNLGVVHRDLKPSNILLKPITQSPHAPEKGRSAVDEYCPKIADFGLARLIDQPTLTLPGQPLGTPSYMAPEQIGNNAQKIGPGTDIYGLGAILYEMLSARPPFASSDPALTMAMIQRDEPLPPRSLVPAIPQDIQTICLKCLSKEPHQRYPSVTALRLDLLAFLQNRPIAAKPAGQFRKVLGWCRRHPAIATAILTSCSLLITVTVGAIHYAQVSEQLRSEAWERSRLADDKEQLQARQQELIRSKFELLLHIHHHFLLLLGDPKSGQKVNVEDLRPQIMRSASELSAPYVDMLVERFRSGIRPSPDEVRLAVDYTDMAFVSGASINLSSRLPELHQLVESITSTAQPSENLFETQIRLKALEARLTAREGNHIGAGNAYCTMAELIERQLAVMNPNNPARVGRLHISAGMLMNARVEYMIAKRPELALHATLQAEDTCDRLIAADPNNQDPLLLLLEIRFAKAQLLPPAEAATLARQTLHQFQSTPWKTTGNAEKAGNLLEQLQVIAESPGTQPQGKHL